MALVANDCANGSVLTGLESAWRMATGRAFGAELTPECAAQGRPLDTGCNSEKNRMGGAKDTGDSTIEKASSS